MDKNTQLRKTFNEWEFYPNDKQICQFNEFYDLLVDWNTRMNLTGITDYEDVLTKHFIDSLMLGKFIPEAVTGKIKLIDIGTGAGFPGIPLKIMFPEIECVLLDSLQKRIGFLNHVIEQLGLTGITAVHGRAEEYISDGNREQFDVCVSRAVADLSVLSEYCIPYVKDGGLFVPYKSGHCIEEVDGAENAISTLGGKITKIEEFNLTSNSDGRSLIIIRKISETPDKYPRRSARIMKNPL